MIAELDPGPAIAFGILGIILLWCGCRLIMASNKRIMAEPEDNEKEDH